MSKQIIYREDDVVAANLEVLAGQTGRNVSDEVRAATAVYLDLINLAHFRITVPRAGMAEEVARVERNVRDNIGRVLLASLPGAVVSAFENAAGVESPRDHFGKIHIPFDRLLAWIATGEA